MQDFAVSLGDMATKIPAATGTKLLDFPEEVLTLLPTFFTAVEWAKGPSLTCRTFNRMQLPSLTLDLEVYTPSKEVQPVLIVPYPVQLPSWYDTQRS